MSGFLTRVAARGRRGDEAVVARRGGRSRSPIADIDQRVGMAGFERLGVAAGGGAAGLSGAADESAGPGGFEAGAPLPGAIDPAAGGGGQAGPPGEQRVGAGRADDGHPQGRAARPRHTSGQPGFPPAQEPDAAHANRAHGEHSAGGGREPLRSPARDYRIGRSLRESASAGDLHEIETVHDASHPEPPGELAVRNGRAALVRTFEPAPRPHRDDAAHVTSNRTNGESADHHGAEPLVEDDAAAPGEVAAIREVHHHHHHDRDDRSEHERAAAETTAPPARPAPVTAASVSVIGPLAAGRRSNLRFALRQR